MPHLPTEVLQQIIFEIIHDSNASSPQADLASFARTTRRISSIAIPVLYRSIRIVDGHSAQLLVRTYLSGINPFTLAQGNKFPRAHIESLNFDFPEPAFKMAKVSVRQAYPLDALTFQWDARVYEKRNISPRLDVLADHGFLSNLATLRLRNFSDSLNLVPLLLGPGKPLRQQLISVDIVHSGDDRVSPRDTFASAFILAVPAFVPHPGYFLDLPIRSSHEVFGDDGEDYHLEPSNFIASDIESFEHACESIRTQACYDFDTFASIWNRPFFGEDNTLRLSKEKLLLPPSETHFDALSTLRIRIESQSYLPILFNRVIFPSLKTLSLLTDHFLIHEGYPEVKMMRRSISRFGDESAGIIIGPRKHMVNQTDKRAIFGVKDISHTWPPLSIEQVENYGDYQGPELDLLDLSEVDMDY